jgi:PAS domain S-box-containing protein
MTNLPVLNGIVGHGQIVRRPRDDSGKRWVDEHLVWRQRLQAPNQSDKRFRLVVEASPTAMVIVGLTGRIELVNAETERVFGYPREELLGQSVEILIPERYRRDHASLRQEFFADASQSRPMGAGRELFGRRKNGAEFPLEIGLNPIETDEGPKVVLSAIVDVSARRRMEALFRLVVEASPSAMVMTRANGQIEMVNAQTERIFGYTRQELLGQNIEMLVPQRFRGHHAALRKGFFTDPRARQMGAGLDLFGLRRDGTEFPLEIGLNPIETDEGPMVLAAVIDITQRRASERALARSEAELRASFEGAAVGKILAEPESRRVLRVNRAFARMLGYEPEAFVGRTCPEFVWHEDRAEDAADHDRLLAGEDAIVREMRYIRIDGSPLWVRVSTTIARVPGSTEGAIVVRAIEDIDTRYKAEIALRVAKQQLEQVVEERTDALNQRNLLLREVYHRVKNNLQLVDSLLTMQGRKLDDPRAKEAVLSLRARIFALGLVHQQLMGSEDLKTFDVVPFLDDLSNNILEGSGTEGVTLWVDACTLDVGLDFAVPLGLLVTELVTNSLKHAFPGGTGSISVILRREMDQHLILTVSDNGIGQTSGDPADAGLGTRIITSLVRQLEGTMTVRTADGMTTDIRLPVPAAP